MMLQLIYFTKILFKFLIKSEEDSFFQLIPYLTIPVNPTHPSILISMSGFSFRMICFNPAIIFSSARQKRIKWNRSFRSDVSRCKTFSLTRKLKKTLFLLAAVKMQIWFSFTYFIQFSETFNVYFLIVPVKMQISAFERRVLACRYKQQG